MRGRKKSVFKKTKGWHKIWFQICINMLYINTFIQRKVKLNREKTITFPPEQKN